ncbi:MAG: radical SAM protein [Candidatus Schekmanbacteria bacterium]|nr:radical SAM protein [Candidatus Schekmanbacteria bacterium]
MDRLPAISLSAHHNYVAFFLTLACNLRCAYCINLHDGGTRYAVAKRKHLDTEEWLLAIDRLRLRADLPLTLQGGEPTLSRSFFALAQRADPALKMDLLTNMGFDVEELIRNVPVSRFVREAPYAAIRVTYHPGQNDIDAIIEKTVRLEAAGFRVGIYGIRHPDPHLRSELERAGDKCLARGLDFRWKEFLGLWQNALHGTYKYEGAVSGQPYRGCECRTTELIVDPAGYVFRCHSDLYRGRGPIGHILDPGFDAGALDAFRYCAFLGDCNPCDVKVKTNRLQIFGHTSVEIRNVDAAYLTSATERAEAHIRHPGTGRSPLSPRERGETADGVHS